MTMGRKAWRFDVKAGGFIGTRTLSISQALTVAEGNVLFNLTGYEKIFSLQDASDRDAPKMDSYGFKESSVIVLVCRTIRHFRIRWFG